MRPTVACTSIEKGVFPRGCPLGGNGEKTTPHGSFENIMKRFETLILLVFAVACLTSAGCEPPAKGKVIQRVYTPSSVGVGSGMVNGKVGTVTTFQSQKYTLIIQNDDGTVVSRTVSAQTYGKCPEGTRWDETPPAPAGSGAETPKP